MIAFDTDVLTEILLGNAIFAQRASAIPLAEQSLPVVVIEEIMRGRLNPNPTIKGEKKKLEMAYAHRR
jgi:predicted nucleic acid-binding protein